MSSTTETIKERLSIADVVGSYVKLEHAGANLKARCPFHNEKTPSFTVSPVRNSYYCFGCGAKGDIFSFVEQFEGLDFPGALKVLAERAGVPLERENKGVRDRRERLFAVLEDATRFYEETLVRETQPQGYLASRGLLPETVRAFRLGWAPDTWRSVSTFLLQKGYSERELEEAGLLKRTDRGFYDRFRGRIMFPIADPSGRIIAFSGRIFTPDGTPAEVSQQAASAKYVNSPETPLYNKSQVLYGFDKAKFNIRTANAILVVEGQMDLVLAHQAGFTHAVALSGTALTEAHVLLMRRLSPALVLALDADEAGMRAAGRSAHIALAQGMEVRVARLPLGRDPADLVREGGVGFAEAIAGARHIIEFYLAVLVERGLDERTLRLETVRIVLPFIASMQNAVERAHFVALVARRLALPEQAVSEELARLESSAPQRVSSSGDRLSESRRPHATLRPNASVGRRQVLLTGLLGIIVWQESKGAGEALRLPTESIRERIFRLIGRQPEDFFDAESPPPEREALIFEAELLYGNAENLHESVEEMLTALEAECGRLRFALAARELRAAEVAGDTFRIERALAACDELSKQLVGR